MKIMSKFKFQNSNKQQGQVALIVMVVSAVVMTLGLSLSKTSVIQTKISTDEELLKQAFNAAESGIDYYLKTNRTEYLAPDSSSGAQISVNTQLGHGTTVDYDELTLENRTALFWLVGHRPESEGGGINYGDFYNGTGVNICVQNDFSGSLKIDYFYRSNAGVFGVRRRGVNLGAVDRVAGFSDVTVNNDSCDPGRKLIQFNNLVESNTVPLLLAVKPIFQSGALRLQSQGINQLFPTQGIEITSIGRAGNVAAMAQANSSVSRQVSVINRYEVPAFLLEGLTAEGSIISQ